MVTYVKAALALLASTYVKGLYYEPVATYKPYTDIRAELAYDTQQQQLEAAIAGKTEADFELGLTYYEGSSLFNVDTSFVRVSKLGSDSPISHFKSFYGKKANVKDFVTAALKGTRTRFNYGNVYFFRYFGTENDVIEQFAKKGSSYVVQYVAFLAQLEDAVSCAPDLFALEKWDRAVAYYTGSLEGVDGQNDAAGDYGYFMYGLADKRGANFKTLGDGGDSTDKAESAKANIEIMRMFTSGGYHYYLGNVDIARSAARRIISLSRIPLVQGTLRYAYKVGVGGDGFKAKAEGAAFAAAILPSVYYCSPRAAKIVYTNTKLECATPDYPAVKRALESVYWCLGITCEDVGGLVSGDDYLDGEDPAINCRAQTTLGKNQTLGEYQSLRKQE